MKQFFILLNAILFSTIAIAQEVEGPLIVNPELVKQAELERSFPDRAQRGGGSIALPFVDDFSRYSFPTDNPDVPVEWQMWEETGAYLNNSMALFPPTIGTATLDGLDGTGYPYDFSSSNSFGPADTLTSLPIDIAAYDAGSNVYLTFYYQRGGRGNTPEEEDRLYVDFFSPDDDAWFEVWSADGGTDTGFDRTFIKVEESWFFRTEFQFRFRNEATLSGSLDHWNIDYVVLDANIDPQTYELIDVAIVHPQVSLLDRYTAMPWTHFSANPASHMAQTLDVVQGNLNEDRNIVSGYRVLYNDIEQFDEPSLYLNTTGNGFSDFTSNFPINTAPASYIYDSSVNDTCAYFDVEIYTNTTPDQNRWNDTLHFQQEFLNYYAYDDGSAERVYALQNAQGGQLAVKYQTAVPDTLIGLFMYFSPFAEDVSGDTFLLRAWGDNEGTPGDELAENFEFQYPTYYTSGPNVFGYYEYDNPIAVDGTFYVGWVQNTNAELNIGLDKAGTSNTSNLFYTTGIGSSWSLSTVEGSVMIRPVFKAGKSEVWNGIEESENAEFIAYPNPTNGRITIESTSFGMIGAMSLYDLSGRLVEAVPASLQNKQSIDISMLPSGIYVLHVEDRSGQVVHREKIVKQ